MLVSSDEVLKIHLIKVSFSPKNRIGIVWYVICVLQVSKFSPSNSKSYWCTMYTHKLVQSMFQVSFNSKSRTFTNQVSGKVNIEVFFLKCVLRMMTACCTSCLQPFTHVAPIMCKTIYKLLWKMQSEIRCSIYLHPVCDPRGQRRHEFKHCYKVSRWFEELSEANEGDLRMSKEVFPIPIKMMLS